LEIVMPRLPATRHGLTYSINLTSTLAILAVFTEKATLIEATCFLIVAGLVKSK